MLTVRSTINISSQTVPPIIPVVQGDTGRAILFTLADFTIPAGASATYYVQKPSGEAVYNNATIDGNTVLVELTAQSIIEKGDNYGQVRISSNGEVVTSFDFILLVKEFRGIDAVQSLTEMNIFDKAVEQASDAIDEVKTDALDDIGDAKEAALQEIEQTTGNFADDFSASATYAAGDYVMHSGQLYRFTANHAAGAWTGSDAESVTVGEELTDLKAETSDLKEDKAEIDGYYQDMTVGNAEQLASTVFTDDSTPYLLRTTGGSADVGDREYVDAVVGGTVAWNQLARNGNFADKTTWSPYNATYDVSNNEATITPTSDSGVIFQDINTIVGHKYLGIVEAKCGTGTKVDLYLQKNLNSPSISSTSTSYTTLGVIAEGDRAYIRLQLRANSGTGMMRNCNSIDLTQVFGAQIADYIYGLETANAGAGVAWFKKLFPKPYYEYDAGTLISVGGVSAHKTVGFNAWDEEWEVGAISVGDGGNSTGQNIRSKNYIPVLPNTSYYLGTGWSLVRYNPVIFYDANKNFLSSVTQQVWNNTITIPSNAYYMRFYFNADYGTTYKNDICINLSWDGEKDGQYEPYVEHTYPLDSDVVLRGIPKLDASNNLYYDGDEYPPDGAVNRRYGIVDLGTLDWTRGVSSSSGKVYFDSEPIADKKQNSVGENGNTICALNHLSNNRYATADDPYNSYISYGELITVYADYTDAASFKAAMSGVMLVYELAESTTETAEPYQQTQICDDFGTEEFISTSPVPVGHNTRYAPNLRAKLEMSPDSPDGDGVYVVQQSNGENTYIPIGSAPTIQNILDRLTALENA